MALFALTAQRTIAAEYTPYVSGKVAFSNITADSDGDKIKDHTVGPRLAIGAAKKIENGNLRAEIEFGLNNKAEKSETYEDAYQYDKYKVAFKNATAMINGYFDFDTKTAFKPYIGAGIGIAKIESRYSEIYESDYGDLGANLSKTKYNFAYQLTAGVAYQINPNLSFDLSYRYSDFGKAETSGTGYGIVAGRAYSEDIKIKDDLDSNEILVGMRYSF